MRKKKDDGLKAIICLAVATLAVGGASIAVSSMDQTPDNYGQVVESTTGNDSGSGKVTSSAEQNGGTELDITGANAKITAAYKNTDGTYTVVIKEEGYIGEIIIEAVYSADAQTLISYDVLSHTETDNLGSKVDEDDYKALLAGVTLPVTTNGLDISGILGIKAEEPDNAEQVTYEDGTYTAQTEPNEKGDYSYVTVTVENGKVTSVVWDEITGGASKAELSATGKYVMKPIWKTQSESLGAYVVENQTTEGIMNENGYTDVVSGVSINIAGFVDLANQAITEANGNDGTFTVKSTEEDAENYGYVTVTVEDGKITNVVWDEITGGASKAELSANGQYVMKPIWKTQSESLGAYVVENQTTAGMANEKGYTDVVSGVSINIAGFVDLANQALAKASGSVSLKDGIYTAQTEATESGDYNYSTVTIKDGKITNVVWDEITGGASKAELSANGQYVMKPVWKTQSESLGAYVVENQTTEGIMNENGYTDVVSGVSIYVGGFVDLTNQAIEQAIGTDKSISGADGTYTAQTEANENGDYSYSTVTIENGKITNVVWDEITGGASKRELSANGQYVMKPIWKTQSESLGAYVVENQTTEGIMNEKGYTDVVSGVSINVAGFVDLTNQAISQATETGEVPGQVAKPEIDATKVDVISGATFSSKAVIRAIDKGFVFLRDFILNK